MKKLFNLQKRYPKFEVCFARSMNYMKHDMNEFVRENPQTKPIANKLKQLKLNKLRAWERGLGTTAGQDLEHNW